MRQILFYKNYTMIGFSEILSGKGFQKFIILDKQGFIHTIKPWPDIFV